MSFVETRINDGEIVLETSGGAMYSTEVAVVRSGFEARNINWIYSRGRWELGERILTSSELAAITKFFHAMRGRAYGFRFKDWSDYLCSASNGVLGQGVGTGLSTYQLGKLYAQATQSVIRPIKKPVASGFAVQRNGANYAGVSLDTTTGMVTVPALISRTLSAVTKASPGEVTTSVAHGFTTGDIIYFSGVGGMTQLNGNTYTITVTAADKFTLGVNTSSYGTFTSGGTAAKYPQPADALTWSGEFDVPVRFDTDMIRTQFRAIAEDQSEALHYLYSLEIVELRL